jgi:KamA family protein
LQRLSAAERFHMRVVAAVLPFRVNQYVLDQLIDWDRVHDDPIFRIVFPQREMLAPEHFDRVAWLLNQGDGPGLRAAVDEIRRDLNPHPAEQRQLNLPSLHGERVDGLQHKYPETVLVFPSQAQTCHSYCTFCFRWAQFVRDRDYRIATTGLGPIFSYLEQHREVSDVLLTGGDPLVMSAARLKAYLLPLLEPRFDHIDTIRIGTKALSFWPYRVLDDPDADDLLRLLETIKAAGKHVALMVHHDHWRELEPPAAREAIRRVRDVGAILRSQGPILRGVNDSAEDWARLWKNQVRLGIVPYYLFVERDTGARRSFEVPIARALAIYQNALRTLSGLGRTARGPIMSTGPGKVMVQGVAELQGRSVFVLSFIQARCPQWVGRLFFAEYDPDATWFSDFRPWGGDQFFFESEYQHMRETAGSGALRSAESTGQGPALGLSDGWPGDRTVPLRLDDEGKVRNGEMPDG